MKNSIFYTTYKRMQNGFNKNISPSDFLNDVFKTAFDCLENDYMEFDFYHRLIICDLIDYYSPDIFDLVILINESEKNIELKELNDEELLKEFKTRSLLDRDIYDYLSLLFEINRRDGLFKIDSLKSKLFWIILTYYDIEPLFAQFKFNEFSFSPFYSQNEIDNIPEDKLLVIYLLSEETFNSFFNAISSDKVVMSQIDLDFSFLTEKEERVLKLRFGFEDGRKTTLEEAGREFDVTRERIRQVEANAIRKVVQRLEERTNNNDITDYYYSIKNLNTLPYLNSNEFIKNSLNEIILVYLCCCHESRIEYSSQYGIVYDSLICSPDELIDNISNTLDMVISGKAYDDYDFIEKKYIDDNYKKNKNGNYIKIGIYNNMLIKEALMNDFKNGYHASQTNENEDYKKLIKILENKYGLDVSTYTPRNIAANIDRMKDFITVDRGVFKYNDNSVVLTKDLISNIKKYIRKKAPIIRYQAIFDEFKEELKSLGIENRYFLKSLLDPYLKRYTTRRDDIAVKTNETFKDLVVDYVNKTKGIFTINDLNKKFPGNKNYVFGFILDELDYIVFFENNSFIKIDNIKLTEEEISSLKNEIIFLLDRQSEKYITSRKLFSRLVIMNSPILEKHPIINSQFRLFSLLRCLFKDDFCFRRPIISLESDKSINTFSLIYDYLNTLDKFNNKVLNAYTNKMGLRGVYSYLEFINDMSDDFVQIDVETMIKKDKLNLNQSFLNSLSDSLKYYIDNFGEIDTRTYKGYDSLPKINWKWNKYILVGIVRTFMSETFEIENTDAVYNKTDFIIRGLKNEQ